MFAREKAEVVVVPAVVVGRGDVLVVGRGDVVDGGRGGDDGVGGGSQPADLQLCLFASPELTLYITGHCYYHAMQYSSLTYVQVCYLELNYHHPL